MHDMTTEYQNITEMNQIYGMKIDGTNFCYFTTG